MTKLWSYAIQPGVLEKIERCTSIDELQTRVNVILGDLGFVMATYHLVQVNGHGDRLLTFFSNYPDEWLQRYIDQRYMFHDVIHTRSRSSVIPFSWADCRRVEVPERAGLIFGEASEFRLLDGFSVPIHGPNSFAVFSAVPAGSLRERAESIELGRGALTLLGLSVHERAVTLLARQVADDSMVRPHLTPRERECLQWVAAGKNTSIISDIMNISVSTVDAHIQSIMRKLNAQTRAHAAVRAAALGLIPVE